MSNVNTMKELYAYKLCLEDIIKDKKQEIKSLKKQVKEIRQFFSFIRFWMGIGFRVKKNKKLSVS